ncbi:MAG: class I SAM-dependent methyltransferase [Bacteroidota bacterium]
MNYFELLEKRGVVYSAKRIEFYIKEQLFKGVNFKDKRALDIGGGSGLYSFYLALNGAKHAVVMEPEFDGSTSGVNEEFKEINKELGNLNNISLTTKVLEDLPEDTEKFDIILMQNSVNHINEEACVILKEDEAARKYYLDYFNLLVKFCNPGATLIMTDCSNRNFFYDYKIKNPFSVFTKSIEWEKHQSPKTWSELVSEVGFKHVKTTWTSPNVLGKLGQLLLGNKLVSYFTRSHFRVVLTYEP